MGSVGSFASISPSSLAAAASARSAYLSRLRRAFLLRAHPDRFRSHPDSVRRRQAELVQAIGNWMSTPAVLAYTSCSTQPQQLRWEQHNGGVSKTVKGNNNSSEGGQSSRGVYNYVLEKNNGLLMQRTIYLNNSVADVLSSISDALEELGAQVPTPPPPLSALHPTCNPDMWGRKDGLRASTTSHDTMWWQHSAGNREILENMYKFIWSSGAAAEKNASNNNSYDTDRRINHQYDKVSLQGRNILHFLQHQWDTTEAERRKNQRLDAAAAALVTRRAYQFAAIDGTQLGWSSSSVAKVLSSLTSLHDEHGDRLNVQSFYPLRLILTCDEYREELCLYGGGRLNLNPSATKLQWLNTLQIVTEDALHRVKELQDNILEFTRLVQETLDVRIKKGHSCSSREYYECLKRLSFTVASAREDKTSLVLSTTSPNSLIKLLVIVEGPQACRRAKLINEGHIRVGSSMSGSAILSSVARLTPKAIVNAQVEKCSLEEVSDLAERVKLMLNLDKVGRAPFSHVTTKQRLDCLSRLLQQATHCPDLLGYLGGQSVDIAGSGQFCHLGDDGTVVIPWDFR